MKTYQSSARMFVKNTFHKAFVERSSGGKGVSLIRERIMDIITVLQIVVLLGGNLFWVSVWAGLVLVMPVALGY